MPFIYKDQDTNTHDLTLEDSANINNLVLQDPEEFDVSLGESTHEYNLVLDDSETYNLLLQDTEEFNLTMGDLENNFNLEIITPIPGVSSYWAKDELQPLTNQQIDNIIGYVGGG